MAIGLHDGDACTSDDYGDRVIVVDPTGDAIKRQYGVRNPPGHAACRNTPPDGLDSDCRHDPSQSPILIELEYRGPAAVGSGSG
jgi:hypothetical protein